MRKNLYLFILLMIICSITTLATAQVTKVVIRGVVTAAIDKLPLPGAHVMLLNKDGRVVGNAIADMDGNYSMRVETRAGDNLVVSYTGMKKATIPVKGRMTINVVMQDETVMLEGATIVASKKTSNGMMDINERRPHDGYGKSFDGRSGGWMERHPVWKMLFRGVSPVWILQPVRAIRVPECLSAFVVPLL